MHAAAVWLGVRLANGPVDADVLITEAAKAGFPEKTIRRAKGNLKIKSDKNTFDGGWLWFLPPPLGEATQ